MRIVFLRTMIGNVLWIALSLSGTVKVHIKENKRIISGLPASLWPAGPEVVFQGEESI